MKYLCVGYLNAEEMDNRPKNEIESIMAKCPPHLDTFYGTDQVLLDVGVVSATKSIQRNNGEIVVSEENTLGKKELIGSIFIIEAQDIEEAIQIVSLHPTVQIPEGEQLGWRIEVHPVHYYKK